MPNLPLPGGAKYLNLSQIAATGGTRQIADISANWQFSALQPLKPMTPAGTRVRQRALMQGENLIWPPKGDDQFGYWILREFADTCEMLRAVIDTVEDKICAMEWEFRLKPKPGEKKVSLQQRQMTDPRIQKLTKLFLRPDGITAWGSWLRKLLEDMIVCDAAAIYKERDLKGRIANLRVIDGATINLCVTDQGFTPPPPSVAYQQILYGMIWADMTTDDLTYIMHNQRSHKRYGYSLVEQCLVHISIAIRQQDFTQKYFTDGNIPEALCFLPSDLPIDRVKEIQGYIDSVLSGDLARRRRLTFLPGYGKTDQQSRPNIIFPKEVLLKDPLMEWLFQFFCYKLGTSAQAMLRMMNRATAQTSAEQAEEEGEVPKTKEVETFMNDIVQNDLGYPDVEFTFVQRRETDALKQMQIDTGYSGKAVLTVNEIREDLGKDKSSLPEADMLGSMTLTGFIPLEAAQQAARTTQMTAARTAALPDDEPDSSGPPPKGKPPANSKKPDTSKKKVLKRIGATIEPDQLTTSSQKARTRIQSHIEKVFRRQRDKAIAETKRLLKSSKVAKADSDDFDVESISGLIYDGVASYWEYLPSQIGPALEDSMRSGIGRGMVQIEFTDDSMIASANTLAEDYARARAAEMVGMAYDDDGNLIANPDAKWQISETTRQKIRGIVADAFTKETDLSDIADSIESALQDEADGGGIFSPNRANMIAGTEVAQAQVQGNVAVWRESGLVSKVKWLTSEDPNVCPECEGNDELIVGFGKPFPDGSLFPPAHPNCRCAVMVAEVSEGE